MCFEVQMLEKLRVDCPGEKSPHVARIGWSTDNSDFQLGEDKLSWGYGGTGKSSVDSKFLDYGKPYTAGDVVACYIDLDSKPKAIFYTLNGEYLGIAFRFNNELGDKAIFPHVTCKNMRFRVNFGKNKPKHNLTSGFKMMQDLSAEDLIPPLPSPRMPQEAQIIMMVGLPACGKSFWCEKYANEHPEKKFYILGTNNIIDRMKVSGLTRKRNYHGRWEELIKRASIVLNKLFTVTKNNPRNYILDQTNVYFTARRRKMEAFSGYKKIAAVIVNKPEVLASRTEKQQKVEGKIVPVGAVMEMKYNFTLPEKGPSFDEVWYLEETLPKAKELVSVYRQEGADYRKTAGGQDKPGSSPVPEKKGKFEPKPIGRGFEKPFAKSFDASKKQEQSSGKTPEVPQFQKSDRSKSNDLEKQDDPIRNSGVKDLRRPDETRKPEASSRRPENERKLDSARRTEVDSRRPEVDIRHTGTDSRKPVDDNRRLDRERSWESRSQNETQDRARFHDSPRRDDRGESRYPPRGELRRDLPKDSVRDNIDGSGGYASRGRGGAIRGRDFPRNSVRPGHPDERTPSKVSEDLDKYPRRESDYGRNQSLRDGGGYSSSSGRGRDDFRGPMRGRDDFRTPGFREREDLREPERYRDGRPSYGQTPESFQDLQRGIPNENRSTPGRGDLSRSPSQRGGRESYGGSVGRGRNEIRESTLNDSYSSGFGSSDSSLRDREMARDHGEFRRSDPSYDRFPQRPGGRPQDDRYSTSHDSRDVHPRDSSNRRDDIRVGERFSGQDNRDVRGIPAGTGSQSYTEGFSRVDERGRQNMDLADDHAKPRPLMESSYGQRDSGRIESFSFNDRGGNYRDSEWRSDSYRDNRPGLNESLPRRDGRYEANQRDSLSAGGRPSYQDPPRDSVSNNTQGSIMKTPTSQFSYQENRSHATGRTGRDHDFRDSRGVASFGERQETPARFQEDQIHGQSERSQMRNPETIQDPNNYRNQYGRDNYSGTPRDRGQEKIGARYVDPSQYPGPREQYGHAEPDRTPTRRDRDRDSTMPPPKDAYPSSAPTYSRGSQQTNTPQRQNSAREPPPQQYSFDSQRPPPNMGGDEKTSNNDQNNSSKDQSPYSTSSIIGSRGYSYSSSSNKANDRIASSSQQPQMTTSTANYNPRGYPTGTQSYGNEMPSNNEPASSNYNSYSNQSTSSSYGNTSSYGNSNQQYDKRQDASNNQGYQNQQSTMNQSTSSSYGNSSSYGTSNQQYGKRQEASNNQGYQNQQSNQSYPGNQQYQHSQSDRSQPYQSQQQTANKSYSSQQTNQSYQSQQPSVSQSYGPPAGNQGPPSQQSAANRTYQSQQSANNQQYQSQQLTANDSYQSQQVTGNQSYQTQPAASNQPYNSQQASNSQSYQQPAGAPTYPSQQMTGNQTYQQPATSQPYQSQLTSNQSYPTQPTATSQAYQSQSSGMNQLYQTQQPAVSHGYQSQQQTGSHGYQTQSQQQTTNQGYQTHSQQQTANQGYQTQQTATNQTYQSQQPASNMTYQTQQPANNQTYQTQTYQSQPVPSYPPPVPTDPSQSYEKQQEDYEKAYSQWYANYAQAFAQLTQQQPAPPK